ncbi:hypothetical protein L6R52_42545, partial [Myxococcota bacterium]|nr:hypothetical protein [Myxococcota bacterium]
GWAVRATPTPLEAPHTEAPGTGARDAALDRAPEAATPTARSTPVTTTTHSSPMTATARSTPVTTTATATPSRVPEQRTAEPARREPDKPASKARTKRPSPRTSPELGRDLLPVEID